MPRSVKRKRGGGLLEDVALVGLGAYAAKRSDSTGWGIVSKVGTLAMYASIAGYILLALVLLVVLVIVVKQPAAPPGAPTITKETMEPYMAF